VVALTFKSTVDDPTALKHSRDVGTYAGLTPKRIQSGDRIEYDGHISRQSDGELGTALYDAASDLMTRSKIRCTLKDCESSSSATAGAWWRWRESWR
jgi:transposase